MITTWSEMSSPTIEAGVTIDKFQANYVPASQVMNTLAEQSNYWWKIDKEGNLYFLPKDYQDTGYTLERSNIIGKPKVKNGNPLYRNVQYVKGGKNTTLEQVEIQKGDADKQSFTVGYNINSEPTVEVDRGSGFVEEDVGLKGREDNQAWYWERNESTITQDDSEVVLGATDRLRITYIGNYPSITKRSDDTSIATQQSREISTTGQVENAVTQDMEGRQNTIDYADRKLTKYAEDSTTLSWTTRDSSLVEGDLITVNLPELDLDGEDLLVTKIRITDDSGILFYDIEAIKGPKYQTWTEFFNEMKVRAETEIRAGISAEDVLVITYDYSKSWTDADKPNIFRLIYPELGGDWNAGFDTGLTWNDYSTENWSDGRFELFPANDLYPSFGIEDRILYIAFYEIGSEIFRKKITSQSPLSQSPIESVSYIGPEEFAGNIDELRWFGGKYATTASGTGILLDTVTFNENKTELEAYQITRIDTKDGDY